MTMVHMIARNTTGGTRNGDVEAALAAAQARSALHDHARLAADVTRRVLARRRLPAPLGAAVAKTVAMIFANEAALLLRAPSGVPDRASREALLRGFDDEAARIERFSAALVAMLDALLAAVELPAAGEWATLTLEVPAITRMTMPAAVLTDSIEATLQFAPDTVADAPVFGVGLALAGDMMKKLLRASSMTEKEARERPHKLKWPTGSDTQKLLTEFVAGTALEPILTAPVTLQVTDKHLFEHIALIGGPGAGKSQTIEAIIARHLERPDSNRIGMVCIDSQGDLLQHIMRHRACKDRLIYVDPTDIAHPPALNLFDLGLKRSEGADARLREAMRNSVLELYELTLGDLLLSELSAKMLVPFRFLCTLMLEIPGATLQDLRAVLDDLEPYRYAVEKLPPTGQRWFEQNYQDKTFRDTRQQIGWRIDGLLVNAAFERMFAARESKLDLFGALNDGKIVLVNTAKEHLRDEASSIFGKYMIAATLAAVIDRARIPEHQRRPAMLCIDEAHEYLSSDIEMLLRQARKYKCSVLLASQTIGDMKPAFRDSLMSCTEIKMAASISDRGAETLAANMKTTSGFIHSQTKTATHARFATHVRTLTRQAVTLQVPFGELSRAPQLTERELAAMLAANRMALTAPPDDRPPHDAPDSAGRDKPRPDMPKRKPRGKPANDTGKGGDDTFWETY
jgi:hypothetical protein